MFSILLSSTRARPRWPSGCNSASMWALLAKRETRERGGFWPMTPARRWPACQSGSASARAAPKIRAAIPSRSDPRAVVRQHLRDAGRQLLGESDVQEFVGAMRIGMRAQHTGDHELGLGKFLAQHGHERNGAAFALIGGGFAE